MRFRFRQSFQIVKGVRLNVGKRGASLSFGKRGFTYNINSKGGGTTVGLPGSGLSYSTQRRPVPVGAIILIVIAAAVLFALLRYGLMPGGDGTP